MYTNSSSRHDNYTQKISKFRSIVHSKAAQFEMLAERASELAAAASKVARCLREENPCDGDYDPAKIWCDLCDKYVGTCLAGDIVGTVAPEFTSDKDAALDELIKHLKRKTKKGV